MNGGQHEPVDFTSHTHTHTHTQYIYILFSVFLVIQNSNIRSNCVTVDEFAHVPAGVSQWERGTFSLYRENPPLIRFLTALPVWLANPRTNYWRERTGPGIRKEWEVGQDFAYANAARYLEMITQARLVVVLLGIACGALIFHWARELHGGPAAVVCAFLWLLDPSVFAHSGVATVDVGAAAVGLLATYWFWRFLGEPSWFRLLLAGTGLGLAQASKFTMLALYPAWTAMALVRGLHPDGRPPVGGSRAAGALRVCAIFLLSLVVLNACYLFQGTGTPLGDFRFISAALRGGTGQVGSEAPASNRFQGSALGCLRIPLPRDYVLGFDSQKHEEEGGHANLVAGRLERRGNLLSPLTTLLYKLPFGTIALLAVASVAATWRASRCKRVSLGRAAVALPAVFLIAGLCSQTGVNWAVRHSLPALPYVLVAAGGFIGDALRTRAGKMFVIACLAFNANEVRQFHSQFLAYTNQLAGGYEEGYRYFLGSNYDWGQDLIRLKHWVDAHPEFQPIVVSCYGAIDPRLVGLSVTALPEMPTPNGGERRESFQSYYLATSSNLLHGLPLPLLRTDGRVVFGRLASERPWTELRPVARVGRSIFVYRITSASYDAFIDPRYVPRDGATL
ncbi:MAG: glycosyltransferase family 39 protein [Isosphaeraceae bacterium]